VSENTDSRNHVPGASYGKVMMQWLACRKPENEFELSAVLSATPRPVCGPVGLWACGHPVSPFSIVEGISHMELVARPTPSF
jgi:hypothetical protein